jgi:hypothetical protein
MNKLYIFIIIACGIALASCGRSGGLGTSGSGSASGGSGGTCNPCRIFSTTTVTKGDFGGVAAADIICNADAAKPNGGSYKALLWSLTRQNTMADWPIRQGISYVRADGTTPIGTVNSYGVFDLPLTNSIISAATTYHWTGIDISIYPDIGGHTKSCNDWTNNTNGVTAATGTGSIAASGAFLGITSIGSGRNCDQDLHFYCVEQ